jgi:hypothetical protein
MIAQNLKKTSKVVAAGTPWFSWRANHTVVGSFSLIRANDSSDIVYGNNVFVIPLDTSPKSFITVNNTTGVETSSTVVGMANMMSGCRFGNGIFMMLDNSEWCWYSIDGVSWTKGAQLPVGNTNADLFYYVAGLWFANGVFYVGWSNGVIATSIDGSSWTNITATGQLKSIGYLDYVGGELIFLSGTHYFTSSDNGVTWSAQQTIAGVYQFSKGTPYKAPNGTFYFFGHNAVGNNNRYIFTSTNLKTWTGTDISSQMQGLDPSPEKDNPTWIFYDTSKSIFLAFSSSWGRTWTSPDAINWTVAYSQAWVNLDGYARYQMGSSGSTYLGVATNGSSFATWGNITSINNQKGAYVMTASAIFSANGQIRFAGINPEDIDFTDAVIEMSSDYGALGAGASWTKVNELLVGTPKLAFIFPGTYPYYRAPDVTPRWYRVHYTNGAMSSFSNISGPIIADFTPPVCCDID